MAASSPVGHGGDPRGTRLILDRMQFVEYGGRAESQVAVTKDPRNSTPASSIRKIRALAPGDFRRTAYPST